MPEKSTSPIFVFQMAKVASRSWSHMLEKTLTDRDVHHFHYTSPERRTKIAGALAAKGAAQTIRYDSMPEHGEPSHKIASCFVDGVWVGTPVDIVTGVRDPVARAISTIAFMTNRLGYKRLPVTIRDGGTIDNLIVLMNEVLLSAQQGGDDADSLVALLSAMVTDYRSWFESELKTAFGIDVFSTRFDRSRSCLEVSDENRLFLYRVEDIVTDGRGALIRSASQFFGRSLNPIPANNTVGEKRFHAFYREFRSKICFSEAHLDWFYDHAAVKFFYNEHEIMEFRSKWSRPR